MHHSVKLKLCFFSLLHWGITLNVLYHCISISSNKFCQHNGSLYQDYAHSLHFNTNTFVSIFTELLDRCQTTGSLLKLSTVQSGPWWTQRRNVECGNISMWQRCQKCIIPIGHVNNISTQCNFHWNFQKYSVKILYTIIYWVCLRFPKWCIMGYSLTCPYSTGRLRNQDSVGCSFDHIISSLVKIKPNVSDRMRHF